MKFSFLCVIAFFSLAVASAASARDAQSTPSLFVNGPLLQSAIESNGCDYHGYRAKNWQKPHNCFMVWRYRLLANNNIERLIKWPRTVYAGVTAHNMGDLSQNILLADVARYVGAQDAVFALSALEGTEQDGTARIVANRIALRWAEEAVRAELGDSEIGQRLMQILNSCRNAYESGTGRVTIAAERPYDRAWRIKQELLPNPHGTSTRKQYNARMAHEAKIGAAEMAIAACYDADAFTVLQNVSFNAQEARWNIDMSTLMIEEFKRLE